MKKLIKVTLKRQQELYRLLFLNVLLINLKMFLR